MLASSTPLQEMQDRSVNATTLGSETLPRFIRNTASETDNGISLLNDSGMKDGSQPHALLSHEPADCCSRPVTQVRPLGTIKAAKRQEK